ncbi:MAG: TrkH family potassium uptake protein [Gemmataceae bacterium]|nr:TrkH family potassium uptake protein [Gemmataceae bacterium]
MLGGLFLFLGAMLLAPIPFALYYRDGQVITFVLSAAVTALAGGLLFRWFRSRDEVTLREGFALVTFTWFGFAVFGSLPYLLSGSLLHPVDAFFESMSGFSTCGASVFTDVEANPKSLLFWRSLSQWLGGMGIIVLGVAILPLLGVGGMQLYEAESAGLSPTGDRLTPRIQDTARLLWGVYVLVTAVGTVLLWLGDMDFFDALCHSFCAISTGGFSTRNASLGAFGTYSQVITIVLMVLGTTNFSLHYYALRGQMRRYWANGEFRFYLAFYCGAILIMFLVNWQHYDDPLANLRDTAFNVSSIVSTTGFATADYKYWPVLAPALLFAAMFVGGCAGSTAGGLKQVRLILLLKHAWLQTARLLHPRQVKVLKLDRRPVSQNIIQDVLGFTVLFLGVFVIASLLLTAAGVDLITAGSGVIACLSTVGPGLGDVGPVDNYARLPHSAKIVLSLCMLLGRLEISTVLVLLFASFWKK